MANGSACVRRRLHRKARPDVPAGPAIVVTGASSGIGLATALAFAREGARLALLGRDAAALDRAAEQCRAEGGSALTCALDIADTAAVEDAARRVVEAYGVIDVWVSCAAVLAFGPFTALPPELFHRVVETNLVGCANGARAALRQFRAQGDRGVLINTSSVLGIISEPHVSAYVATKFAVRGFTACLRQEMRNVPGIHICAVLPIAVDTPMYQKAANYFGRRARSIFPVLPPERIARRIVWLARNPRRESIVSLSGHLLRLAAALAPLLLERLVGRAGPPLQFQRDAEASGPGNAFEAREPHAIRGGWRRYWAGRLAGKKQLR